jgi:methyl-accepting chemotaxis protein
MRIARVVLLVLLAIGAISLFLSAERLWNSHQKVVYDQRLAELADARSDWYQGTVALSFERSVTQVSLALETAAPPAFLQLIEQQRATSDAILTQTRSALRQGPDFDTRAAFLAQTYDTRARIAELREEADAMLARPASGRDAARAIELPYGLKSHIEELHAAAALLVLPDGRSSTEEMMLGRIQALAWEIREYGGRARTFYAIASLTGNPIPSLYVGEALIDTQRARAGWQQLLVAAEAGDVPASLAAAIAEVEAPFATRYLAALDEMDDAMEAMRAGEQVALPYSFEEFFALSNAALDAVAGLAPIAGDQIQDYWSAQIEASKRSRLMSAIAMVVIASIVILSVVAMHRKMIQPLAAATRALQDIAAGDLDRKFRQTHRGLDEIRVIWDALETLSRKLRDARDAANREKEAEQRAKEGIVGELMKALKRLSDGDLTYEITADYGEAYRELTANFNRTCANLRRVVSEVVENAADMSHRAEALGASVDDLSRRTEIQTAMVAETATRLNELAAILDESATSSARSARAVQDAASKAEAGSAVVASTTASMDQIRSTSEEIHGISSMIDGIAFQTSLLSLNAGVEAARAGDAGKGFAVVAQEIRTLADKASDAARQVKDLVAASEESVKSGVENVQKTGQSLRDITDMVKDVTGNISEIDAASRVQSETIARIGQTMQDMDATARQNASMVEDARETSSVLRNTSVQLQSVVSRFVISSGAKGGPHRPMQGVDQLAG